MRETREVAHTGVREAQEGTAEYVEDREIRQPVDRGGGAPEQEGQVGKRCVEEGTEGSREREVHRDTRERNLPSDGTNQGAGRVEEAVREGEDVRKARLWPQVLEIPIWLLGMIEMKEYLLVSSN